MEGLFQSKQAIAVENEFRNQLREGEYQDFTSPLEADLGEE